ncbi:hypothetical protein SteCoe_29418 [Stentor coeruleus]|uniref:Peptidase C1A papain C-terminal domain-containing protein n=1 Tax=Stentor coeruleus TaxID=5963 RepID=A0A1R2B620_9CILI|nr:hypothetical protein SteCoe_29418 [Stentor coeruleus]
MELEFYKKPQAYGKKIIILAFFALIGIFALASNSTKVSPILTELELQEKEFIKFVELYQIKYDDRTYSKKFQAFLDNSAYIRRHNQKSSSWKMSLNEFSDLSPSEFTKKYLNLPPRALKSSTPISVSYNYPQTVDWRLKGAVTQAKNQGSCGSCYAFSSAAAIESIIYIKTGRLEELSIQQIVDCSKGYGNEGCGGGWMDYAFEYAMKHGIVSLNSYKYTGASQNCQYDKLGNGVKIAGYEDVIPYNIHELASAVSKQPVSISVDATVWQFYSTGVIDDDCGTSLNHGVVAVGYSFTETEKYWIIKNSWGSYWGEQGFLKVAMSEGPGLCGVNMISSYPVL